MTPAESILQSLGLVGLRVRYTDPINTYTLPEAISLQGQIDAYIQADNDNAFYALDRALWTTATTIPTPTITLKQFIQSFLSAVAAVFQARGLQQVAEQLRFQNNIDRILGATASRIQKFENDAARQTAAISRYLAVMPGTTSIIPTTPSITDADFNNTAPINTTSIISNIGTNLPSILASGNPAPALPADLVTPVNSLRMDAFLARLYVNMISDSLLQIDTGNYGASGATTDLGTGLVDTLKDILVTHSGGQAGSDPAYIFPSQFAGDTVNNDVNSTLYDFLKNSFQPGWVNTVIPAILGQSATWSNPRSANFATASSFDLPSIQSALALVSSADQTNWLSPVRADIVNWTNDLSTGNLNKVATNFYSAADAVINDYNNIASHVTSLSNGGFYNPNGGGAGGIASPAKPYNASTSYTTGQCVFYKGLFYKALQSSTNKNPFTEPTYWAVTAGIGPYWDGIIQDGSLYSSANAYIVGEGSSYFNTNDGLFYKARYNIITVNSFSSVPSYDNSHAYVVGDVVNSGGSGSYFQATQAGTGHTPTGEAGDAYWKTIYVAENFSSSHTYHGFDIVYDPGGSGNLYRCIAKTASPGTDPINDTANWQKITFGNTAFFSPQSAYQFQMGAMMKGVAQSLANMGTQLTSDYVGGWDNTLNYTAGNIVGNYNTGTQTVDYYTTNHNINQKSNYSTAASYVEGDVFIDSANQRWITKSTAGSGYNAAAFDSSTDYSSGSVVSYTGNLYVRNATQPSTLSITASYSTNQYVTISSQSYKVLQNVNYRATLTNVNFATQASGYSVQDSFVYSGNAYLIKSQSLSTYTTPGTQYSNGSFVSYANNIYKRNSVSFASGDDLTPGADNSSNSGNTYWTSYSISSYISEQVTSANYIWLNNPTPPAAVFSHTPPIPTNTTYWSSQTSAQWANNHTNIFSLYNDPIIDFFTYNSVQSANVATIRSETSSLLSKLNNYMGGFVPSFSPLNGYTQGTYVFANNHNYLVKNGVNIVQKGSFDPNTAYSLGQVFVLDNFTTWTGGGDISPTYEIGDYASFGGNIWECLHTSINDQPRNTTITGTRSPLPSFSLSDTYTQGECVLYNGDQWQCNRKTRLSITSSTKANPVVITTSQAHGLSNGDTIFITGANVGDLNENSYTVANVTDTTFQLSGIDGTSFDTYTGGGRITGFVPSNSSSFWTKISNSYNSLGIAYITSYDGSKTYTSGSYVTDGTHTWKSTSFVPVAQTPSSSSSYWSLVVNASAYSGGSTYYAGDYVTQSGSTYRCIAKTAGNSPSNPTYWTNVTSAYTGGLYNVNGATALFPQYWNAVSSTTSIPFITLFPTYNPEETYTSGQGIIYGADTWQALRSTTGNTPVNGSTYWSKITSIFNTLATDSISTYSQASAYGTDDFVTDGTDTWQSVAHTSVGSIPSVNNSNWNLVVFAPNYAAGTYYAGDYVIYSGQTWKCLATGGTASSPSAGVNWTQITSGVVNVYQNTVLTPSYGPDAYSYNSTYNDGDIVLFSDQLWQRTSENEPADFSNVLPGVNEVYYNENDVFKFSGGSTYFQVIPGVTLTYRGDYKLTTSAFSPTNSYASNNVVTESGISYLVTNAAPSTGILTYSSLTGYTSGQYVYSGGYVWKALQNSTGQTPVEGSYWTSVTTDLIPSYSSLDTYYTGDYVYYSNSLWRVISETPISSTDPHTPSSGNYWNLIDTLPIGSYSAGTNYTRGDYVYVGGTIYQAIVPSIGENPTTANSSYWQAISHKAYLSGSSRFQVLSMGTIPLSDQGIVPNKGIISPTVDYLYGDTVSVSGQVYQLTANAPALTAYNDSTPYTVGQYITYGNSPQNQTDVYLCIQSGTGQTPIVGGNSSYWTKSTIADYATHTASFFPLYKTATLPFSLTGTTSYSPGYTFTYKDKVYVTVSAFTTPDSYRATQSYSIGSYIYQGGQIWQAIKPSPTGGSNPPSNSSVYWAAIPFEDFLFNSGYFLPLVEHSGYIVDTNTGYAVDLSQARQVGDVFVINGNQTGFTYVVNSVSAGLNAYSPNATYVTGNYVSYGGSIWKRSSSAFPAGISQPPGSGSKYWSKVAMNGYLSVNDLSVLNLPTSPQVTLNAKGSFNASTAYALGDAFINGTSTYVTVNTTSGLAAYSGPATYNGGDYVSFNGSIWQRTTIPLAPGISSNVKQPQQPSIYWTLVSTDTYINNSGFFNRLVTAPNNLFLDVSTPNTVPTGEQSPFWNDISSAKWIFNDVNSSMPHFSTYTTPTGGNTLPSFFFQIDPLTAPSGGSPSIIDSYLTTLSCSLTGYQGFLDNLNTTLIMLENFVAAATSSSDFATVGINLIKNILNPQQGMLLGNGGSVSTLSANPSVSNVYNVLSDWKTQLNNVATSGVGTRVAIAGLLKTTIQALMDLVTSDAGHTFQGNATRATAFKNAAGTFYSYITTDFSGIQSSIAAILQSIQSMFSGYVLNPLGTFQSAAIDALSQFVNYFEGTFKTLSGASMNTQIANGYFNLNSLFEAIPQALKYRIEASGIQLASVLPLTAANKVQAALRYVFDTLSVPTYQVGSTTEKTPPSLRYQYAQHYYEKYLASSGPSNTNTQNWLAAVNDALNDVGGPTIGSSGNKGYLANLYDAFIALRQQILMPSETTRLVCATNGNSLNYLNTSSTQASLQAFNGIKNSIVNLMNGLDNVLTRTDFVAPPKVLTGVQKVQNDLIVFWGNNLKDSSTYPVANMATYLIDFINNTLIKNQQELIGNNTPTALPSSPSVNQIYATLTSWNSYLQTSNILLYNVIQTILSNYFVGAGSSFALPGNNNSLISVVQIYASNQYAGPMAQGSQDALSSLSAINNTASTNLLIAAYKNFIQNVLESNSIQLIGVEQQNQIDPIGDSPTQSQTVACLRDWVSALDHTTSVFTSYDADRSVMSQKISSVITQMLDYNNNGTAVILHGGDGDASLTSAVNAIKSLRATSEITPILASSNTRLGNDHTHLAGFPGYYAPFRTELTDNTNSIYASAGTANRYGFDAFNAVRPNGRLVTFKTVRDSGSSDINLSTNTISVNNHGFSTGDAVIFDNCGMSNIGNLVSYGSSGDNQGKLITYYIKVVDANHFQLATSKDLSLNPSGAVVTFGNSQPGAVHTNLLLGYNEFDIQPYVIRSDFIQYSSSTSTACMSLLQMIAGLQNFFSKIQPVRKYGIADVGFYDYGGGDATPLDFATWGWLNGRMTDVCYNLYVPYDLFRSLFGGGGKMRPTWLWSCNYVKWEMEDSYYAAKDYYQTLTTAIQSFNNQFTQFHLAVELNVTRWMSQAFATTSVIDDVMYRIFEADPVSPQESRLAAKVLSILLTIIVAMLASNPAVRDAVMKVASLGTATADSYSGILIEVSLANAMIQRAAAMAADLLDRERASKTNSAEYIASNPVSAQSLFDLASFYQSNTAQQKAIQQNMAAQNNLAQS